MQQERFEYLVSKELGDRLTVSEQDELRTFFTDAEWRMQYNLLQQYWSEKHSQNTGDRELFQQVLHKMQPLELSGNSTSSRKLYYWLGAMASILICIGLWFTLAVNSSEQRQFIADRKQQKVILDDGTEVILNYKSTLLYPNKFSDNLREVTIIGEAFFRVSKETDRPFIVKTKHAQLKVLGTSFNVRAYPDEPTTEASLIEGALEVHDEEGETMILRPSEKAVITNQSKNFISKSKRKTAKKLKIQFLRPTDSHAVETTWLENKLVFKDVTFDELAKTLARKYDVRVDFKDVGLTKLRFSARFEDENLDQILQALQLAASFQYEKQNNKITIYK